MGTHWAVFCVLATVIISEADLINFPQSIHSVIVDLGANADPLIPPMDDASVAVLAIEPLPEKCAAVRKRKHPRLFVLCCAIATYDGIGTLQKLGSNGLLSSLAPSTTHGYTDMHTGCENGSEDILVPVLTLYTVMASIPKRMRIQMLKVDLQGFDFAAVQSARDLITRAEKVYAEVDVGQTPSYVLPAGVPSNGLEASWLPHMRKHGFVVSTTSGSKFDLNSEFQEADVMWVRETTSISSAYPRVKRIDKHALPKLDADPRWIATTDIAFKVKLENGSEIYGMEHTEVYFKVAKGADIHAEAKAFCKLYAHLHTLIICVSNVLSRATRGLNFVANKE